MAHDYRRVAVVEDAKPFHDTEPEAEYWAQFRETFHAQQPSSVTSVEFSPAPPHDLAVTASARVAVLDGMTLEPRHALTKFRAQAFSGRFRPGDGRLLVAGGEEGVVRVFDAASRAELRTFKGHVGPVRCARFARDRVRVVSAGDDGSVREFDLTTSECTAAIAPAHGDHVRALEGSPASAGVWASGAYDRAVRVWDVRAKAPRVASMDHGAPVEALVFFPSGNALVSAGANYLRVWDLLAGGRVIAEVANHQKTITALALDATGTRMLSGGADRLVKVYDVESYRVLHTLPHHAAVLALAMAPDDSRLAIGAADGDLCVLTRAAAAEDEPERRMRHGRARKSVGTVRYFLRGHQTAEDAGAQPQSQSQQQQQQQQSVQYATPAKGKGKHTLDPYDRMLRKFKYSAALDAALETTRPAVIVGMLRELLHRGGLLIALGGRDETTLEPLLVFLVNYVAAPQYSALLITVCRSVIDLYASSLGRSMRVDELFFKLQTRLHREIDLQ
jgi:U3 small nucleolar RNA-associated protein 15